MTDGEKCPLEPGKYDLYNYFKGPLALNDLENRRSTVLYMQDGHFLREIPSIIVGREYIWLGLAAHGKILAIRRTEFSVIPFSVREWAVHVPDELKDDTGTKDQQIALGLNGANLTLWSSHKVIHPYSEESALSPAEFVGAYDCRDVGTKNDHSPRQ